jgi:hypothetical protein
VLATWSTAKVGPDIHAKVGKTLYSVPWRLVGQRLHDRETQTTVQLFHQGELVATPRAQAGRQADRHGPLPAGQDCRKYLTVTLNRGSDTREASGLRQSRDSSYSAEAHITGQRRMALLVQVGR